jgi:hypothetical protein
MMAEMNRAPRGAQHYLEGRGLPANFDQMVPQLIAEGTSMIQRAVGKNVELTVTGLAVVDEFARTLGYAKCLEPTVFARLVAIVGETMRRARAGTWQMQTPAEPEFGGLNEAWIVAGHWRWDAGWTVYNAYDDEGNQAGVELGADLALREDTWK